MFNVKYISYIYLTFMIIWWWLIYQLVSIKDFINIDIGII